MNDPDLVPEFVQLQTKHQQRVFSFILTLVPHWPDAEEILQETNMVLWRKQKQYEPGTDFVRWANQVAYFEVLKHRKRQQGHVKQFSEAFIEDVAEEAFKLSGPLQAQRDALAACLEKLPVKDRALVSHRYLEGATTKTVAASVGRSVEAVYKSLQRIRGALLGCIRRTVVAEEGA
ncbi:MAG: sigma-70 family RNA polymerase sigma factor [Pirellulales bacterium]|nr:sigma-70 family RNA polymerase sigma factor [Pirellulales bacterium]